MEEERVLNKINKVFGQDFTAIKASKAIDYGDDYYSVLIRIGNKEFEHVFLINDESVLPIPG